MTKRMTFLGILLGIGLVVLGIFSWPSSDEEAIAGKLAKLADAIAVEGEENPVMRMGRLRREFEEIFEDDARVHIPELQRSPRGLRELAELGSRATVLYRMLTVSFAAQETTIEPGAKSARTKAMAKLMGSRGGDLRRDERRVLFEWKKSGGTWLISDVTVEPPSERD